MKKAYLSLGSNICDKKKNLEEALTSLKSRLKIINISSYYETEPVDYKDQDWFLNIVAEVETDLTPYELLDYCQSIEKDMKRVKKIRFGPRNIDVDILLYEDFKSEEEKLTIPHPRMKERAFVMIPLFEIAPDILIEGHPIASIIKNLNGEEVRKVQECQDDKSQ